MSNFEKGHIELSLKCCACKQMRLQQDLDCLSYQPVETVTTFFRYCKDKPECKRTATLHKKDKLLS